MSADVEHQAHQKHQRITLVSFWWTRRTFLAGSMSLSHYLFEISICAAKEELWSSGRMGTPAKVSQSLRFGRALCIHLYPCWSHEFLLGGQRKVNELMDQVQAAKSVLLRGWRTNTFWPWLRPWSPGWRRGAGRWGASGWGRIRRWPFFTTSFLLLLYRS